MPAPKPITALLLLALPAPGGALYPDAHAPQPQSTLRRMVRITWRKGPSLPQGFQDSAVGIVGGTLATAGGFCSGQKNVPGKPDRYPRGFLNRAWALDLATPAAWAPLPPVPMPPRQGLVGIVVGGALYAWPGLNYTAPHAYRDGYRLSRQGRDWRWDRLPDLPGARVWPGIAAIGSRIYLFGGGDYDSERFYTRTDRTGADRRLGAHLLVFDTDDVASGWKALPDCPGTPRFTPAVAAVGRTIVVIGGAGGDSDPAQRGYKTVVDNWEYDVDARTWRRLRDLPVASGNFPSGTIVFRERYVLLVGGCQYPKVENPDGTYRAPYGAPFKHYRDNPYFSDVWVYDAARREFGTADPLPLNNNTPMTVVRDDTVYLLGGETRGAVIDGEHFGHHPDLLLIGTMRAVD